MTPSIRSLMPLFLAAPIALTPLSSVAQSDDDFILEEVIVTGRKLGTEVLQDIPASITAFGEDLLEDMSVSNFEDFAYQVPGLTFLDQSPGERRYVIRGIQSAGQQQVAVYYDEVPLPGVQSSTSDSGSQTPDLKLYDMERIEVLRGPQGTVFGANSQSGTVRFITKKPVFNEFEAMIGGEFSSTSESDDTNFALHAVANLPLVQDTMALRVLVYGGDDAGYVDNTRLNIEDINSNETEGIRALWAWEPSERIRLDAMIWAQDRDLGGDNRYHPFDTYGQRPGQDNGDRDNVAQFTFFQTGDFVVGDYAQTFKPDDQRVYSLTGTIGFDWADMTVAYSRYNRDFGFKFDSTWIITFLFENIDPSLFESRSDLVFALTDQQQELDQDAFEIRFNSNDDGPVQWVGGAFYRKRESEFQSFVPVIDPATGLTFDPGTPFTIPPTSEPGAGIPGCHPCVFARFANKDIEETAIFGEVNWAINERWDLNLGARWFEVEQSDLGQTVFNFAAFAPNPPTAPALRESISDNEFLTKVSVAYNLSDDVTFYGLRSQGFRLGGTNNQGIVAVPELFEADELINWEFGAKTVWQGGRLVWNTSLFHEIWENIQVAGQDPTGAFGFIGNAGEAEVNGIETEIYFRPSANWDITANLSFLDKFELTEDQISEDVVAPGRAGDLIPRIPELTFGVMAQYNYELPLEGWSGYVRAETSFKDDSRTELRPDSPNDRDQDSYTITNLRIGFSNDPMGLDLIFFAENLFDEDGDVFIGVGNGEPTFKYTNRPRTVGIEFRKRFGG